MPPHEGLRRSCMGVSRRVRDCAFWSSWCALPSCSSRQCVRMTMRAGVVCAASTVSRGGEIYRYFRNQPAQRRAGKCGNEGRTTYPLLIWTENVLDTLLQLPL